MVEDVSCEYSTVRDRIDQLSEEMEPLKVHYHTIVLLKERNSAFDAASVF